MGDSGAAENVQTGAEKVSAAVPDAIAGVLGIASDFFSGFLVLFTVIFICMFLLSDITNLKRALGSVLMPGEDERWLGVWERVTSSISRWVIGVVVIAVIAGTVQGTTAWLLGSSYALGLDRFAAIIMGGTGLEPVTPSLSSLAEHPTALDYDPQSLHGRGHAVPSTALASTTCDD